MQNDFFQLSGAPPRMLEILREMHEGSPHRWMPRRALFCNWWLFEGLEEIFFGRGNLMLTGRNESGKTTVLVSLLNLVLDRDFSSRKIDTTGDRARSVRYYLIGDENAQEGHPFFHHERTGYVALEFEMGDTGRFATIGVALRTSRSWTDKHVVPWSFVIRDGHRIGYDLDLVTGSPPRPLTRTELRDALGPGGQVYDDRQGAEYVAAVNELLFGFQGDDYRRFLDVLIQVRRPRLGEGLTPDRVAELLVDALPSVDMRPIENAGESFRRMDTIEAELQAMEDQRDRAERLDEAQVEAVRAGAMLDAHGFQQARTERDEMGRAFALKSQKLERTIWERDDLVKGIETAKMCLAADLGTLEPLEEELRGHDAFKVGEELEKAKSEHAVREGDRDSAQQDLEQAEETRIRLSERAQALHRTWENRLGTLRESVSTFAASARDAYWPALGRRAENANLALDRARLEGDDDLGAELALAAIEYEANERVGKLDAVIAAHSALEAERKRYRRLEDERKRAEGDLREADRQFGESLAKVGAGKEAATAYLTKWRGELVRLRVPEPAFEKTLVRVQAIEDPEADPLRALEPIHAVYKGQDEELEERTSAIREMLRRSKDDAALARKEIEMLLRQDEREPERDEAAIRARAALREAGIPSQPLFAAVDFRENALSAQECATLEGVLEEAGLLDALLVPADRCDEVAGLLDDIGLGDRWIRPGAPGAECAWLVPVEGAAVAAADIAAALGTFGCGVASAAGIQLYLDGRWSLGPLEGRAAGLADRVRFVGATNRRRERDRQLAEARARLAEIEAQIEGMEEEGRLLKSLRTELEREWTGAARAPLTRISNLIVMREHARRALDTKRAALSAAIEAERSALAQVEEKEIALARTRVNTEYTERLGETQMATLRVQILGLVPAARALLREMAGCATLREESSRIALDLRSTGVRFEELTARLREREQRLASAQARVDILQTRFHEQSGSLEELQEKVSSLQGRIRILEKSLQDDRESLAKANGRIEMLQPAVEDLKEGVRRAEIEVEEARLRLERRLRSYPVFEGQVHIGHRAGWDQVAEELLAEAGEGDLRQRRDTAKLALQQAYFENQAAFGGHGIRLEDELIRFSTAEGDLLVSEMFHRLEDELGRKSQIRDEEDRKIIEQVFLREITESIRETVRATDAWVQEVSDVLETMEFPGSRVLRLKWKVRERAEADGYDPRRLDALFKQRSVGLDDNQQEELVEIFRSMVAEIRQQARENEQSVDYRSALAEMLDYKKWYRLVILRKEANGEFQELTKKRYGVGSIGRRTLDLVLPLIAAVCARFAAAANAAPLLIGFDEAFAGVDDQNAAQIYGLLDKLGLCWIMATEKATNYGDHVRGATIYEFINDGHTVAPTASVWDGARRHAFEIEELGAAPSLLLEALPDA